MSFPHEFINVLPTQQYEHERKDHRRPQPDSHTVRPDQPYMDSSVSSMRIENMELRRKIDDLETQNTEMQQKHLKEVSVLCSAGLPSPTTGDSCSVVIQRSEGNI